MPTAVDPSAAPAAPSSTIAPRIVAPPRRAAGSLALLAAIVLATFARLIVSDFTWYDDQQTLHQNPMFNPPGWHTIADTWTRPHMGLYVPVTYTVWTAVAMFARVDMPDEFNVMLNPWLFHAANVAVHLGSTWLAFFLLRRLLATRFDGDVTTAALAGAALFAVHPLQVETIGWVSGMKDLLCWFGTLGATLLYVRRVQAIQANGGRLWASWTMPAATLVFALAVLSKPSAVVAPAAMLAIDGLVLRRQWLRAAIELLPLFAMSALAVLAARQFQFVGMAEHVPLWQRPFVAGDAVAFYLSKLFVPYPLTIDYGRRPTLIVEQPTTYALWLVPAALAVAAFVAWRRRAPLLTLAAALAAIGIAPVSGLATFQMQQFSTTTDHYVYFAMIGPALLAAWALARWPVAATRAAAVAVVVACAARSFDQSRIWHDAFALFGHASAVRPGSVIAQNNLASIQLGRMVPDLAAAERHVKAALAVDPDNYYALQTYGVVKSRLRDGPAAAQAFDRLWALCERHGVARATRLEVAQTAFGAMMTLGDYRGAVEWAERGVAAAPDDFTARSALAEAKTALAKSGASTWPTAATTTAAPAPGPASAPSR